MSEDIYPLLHFVDVRPAGDGFRLWVKFNDGYEGIADLSPFAEKPIYGWWKTRPGYFENVALEPFGMLAWDKTFDLHAEDVRKAMMGITGRLLTEDDVEERREYPDIAAATALHGYKVRAFFADGKEGVADFSDWVENEYYEGWKTKEFDFVKKAKVEPWGLGWGRWLNDISLSGDWIYERLQHA